MILIFVLIFAIIALKFDKLAISLSLILGKNNSWKIE